MLERVECGGRGRERGGGWSAARAVVVVEGRGAEWSGGNDVRFVV